MAICSCGSPARCCQPAVAGGVIYVDLRGELSTHLALRLCLLGVLLGEMSLLQAFPSLSTLGEVVLHTPSLAGLFIYSSRGKWVFPPSCGVLLPPPLL
jgi:hypothetical protein